jgi:hypothetical protein
MALLAALLWAGVGLGLVLCLAWLLAGPEGWIQGSWGPLLLDLLLALLVGAATVAFLAARRRWLTEQRLARCLDDAAGLRPGTVLSSLELGRGIPVGVSASLARFAEGRVARSLDLPPRHLAGTMRRQARTWVGRALAGLALLAPALIVLTVLAPGRSLSAWGGLSSPVRLLSVPALPPLQVSPGDHEVLRGSDLAVRVEAMGRASVALHWQADGDVARSSSAVPDQDGVAGFRLAAVSAPLRYWAQAPDGARSPVYRVTPIDPLFVSDLRVEVSFPPHTERLPEEYRGDVPPLSLPVGSRIRIDGRASRPLGEAFLRLRDGATRTELQVADAGFSGLWVPRESGVWLWSFRDAEGGVPEIEPSPIEITLVADEAPQLVFTFPARDTLLPLNLRQPLVLQASDDYGLARVEMLAWRVSATGEVSEPLVQTTDLGGAPGAVVRPLLDVSEWGLLPGDQVRYRARAVDNAPAAQTVETREWSLRMPEAAELRRDAQARLEQAARRMEELSEQARLSLEENRNLQRQAAAERGGAGERTPSQGRSQPEQGIDFEQREELRQALEQQEELAGAVDSLRSEVRDLEEAMREAGLAEEDLRADLQELQRLLEQIAPEDLMEQLQQMERGLEEMDSRTAQESLRQLTDAQERFREQLEESLERFRRAAVEQDFRATRAEAEELARQERALAEAMREGPEEPLRAEQQGALEERAGEVEESMERLEEQLQQLGEQEAAEGVREAMEQAAEARQSMAQASQSSRARQPQQAAQSAEQAASQMQQAASQLQQAQSQMADQRAEAMREALGQTAQDALSLARRQSEIRQEMRDAGGDRMSELRGDVGAVLQGVRNMAENLSQATEGSGGSERQVSERMGQAMEALERTLSSMESRPGPGPSPVSAADQAVESLNQLALQALASADQMGQSGQGQQGEMQDLMQQLESLAQQQGELNSQSGQIMPMQLGQQALQSQLQPIAEGQNSVAGELGKLAERPGSEGALGDLEALAREAQALAAQLAGGRLDGETRQRQERLFHRLLDAGRTLEKEDEQSEERESTTAGEVERAQVAPLSAEATGALRFRLPDASVLQRLTPAERQLVLQYFERLNRERRARGGAAEEPEASPGPAPDSEPRPAPGPAAGSGGPGAPRPEGLR